MVSVKASKPVVQKWPVIILASILISLGSTKPQFPMGIPAMQMIAVQSRQVAIPAIQMVPVQPRQMAVPIGIPMPVGIAVRVPDTTGCETTTPATTTRTTPKSEDKPTKLRIIIPWPPNSFAGGPPIQMPLPGPPPFMMIPLPPIALSSRERASRSSDTDWSSDSDSSWGSSGSSSSSRSRWSWEKKKWKNKRYGINRRHGKGDSKTKPVLAYVNKKGHVKLRKHLSRKDAETLLHTANNKEKKVRVVAGDDRGGPRVLVQSKSVKLAKAPKVERRAPKLLKSGSQPVGLGDKDLIFRPPDGRKISNLTVSFRISR